MFAALITPILFSFSAVSGQKVAVELGAIAGNLVRLFVAGVILGLIVMVTSPETLSSITFPWFFVSGVIGFGIGDIGLFLAYERIGSRLTMLLNLCLAPVFAIALEWGWLGTTVSGPVLLCILTILLGVTMALRPGAKSRQKMQRRGNFGWGVFWAIVAGFGQGTGAVISRKAEAIATFNGIASTGISAAFQRVLAGFVFALLVFVVLRIFRSRLLTGGTGLTRKGGFWLLGAALFGPVIGVSCFQWALQSLESGIVLAVVALTPVVLIPLAAVFEGDHPTRLAICGAIVAVIGVACLNLFAGG
ncbi:MAG: DMT family transporter [Verrucomicrobiota bacterium]